MSSYSPIVTLGLDPELSRIVTQGYGPEITIEITALPFAGGRGRTGRKKREEEERLIRIRVISEDGKTMIQERLVPLNELNTITIKVSERGSIIYGSDIYLKVKEGKIKESEPLQIRVKTYETSKRQDPNSRIPD